jgi:hypothetical protein
MRSFDLRECSETPPVAEKPAEPDPVCVAFPIPPVVSLTRRGGIKTSSHSSLFCRGAGSAEAAIARLSI